MAGKAQPLAPRFWAKVTKTDGCWLWAAAIYQKTGYGQFSLHGRPTTAHAVAYLLTFGPIPKDMKVDHRCHVRHCVRPDHLRLATNKQNMENLSGLLRNNTSGYRGVSYDKTRNAWAAKVKHNGRTYYCGRFATVEAAHASVAAKRNELFTHNDADRT